MQKTRLLVGSILCAVTLGCGRQPSVDAPITPAESSESPPTIAEPTFPDGGPVAGTYDVTFPDGTKNRVTLGPDGSVAWSNGTLSGSGRWRFNEEGQYCTTFDKAPEGCFVERIDDAGVWTSAPVDAPESAAIIKRISP